MATRNELLKPPAEELTDRPVPQEFARAKAAKIAKTTESKKSVLIINGDNDIYFEDDQSVPMFMSAFKNMGYKVIIEKPDETSYSTWNGYNIVVWSCGDDYSAVNDIKSKRMLTNYVAKPKGRLLLESGNIAAWLREETGTTLDHKFRETVLHATTDWAYRNVGDLTLKTNHPIATKPNKLPQTIGFTPTDPGDESGDANAVRILPDAIGIYNWSHVAYGDKLVRDDIASISYGLIASEIKNGGKMVYFAFDIDDIDSPELQQKLIQNSENWLSS